MPLLWITRFFLSMLSLLILAAGAWLAWDWYSGDWVRDASGTLYHVRHNWQLWTAAALLVWSFGGGGMILRPFLARRDVSRLRPGRGDGDLIRGADGSSLYVEETGPQRAPCLILTHGWGLDSTIWAYAKQELGRRYRLVLWDLPGMGKSRGRIGLEAFAADLAVLIERTGDAPVILAGHSIGGMTIQTLARDHPEAFDRVAGVVLINTTCTNPLRTMILSGPLSAMQGLIEAMMHLTIWLAPLAWLSAWHSYLNGTAHIVNRLGFGPHVTHSQLDYTALLTTRNSPAAQARGNIAMFHWDATGALANIDVPVLVLGGKDDIVTRPEASTLIAGSAPNGRATIFEDANHMGFLSRSDVYNAAIGEFADRVTSSPKRAVTGRIQTPPLTVQ